MQARPPPFCRQVHTVSTRRPHGLNPQATQPQPAGHTVSTRRPHGLNPQAARPQPAGHTVSTRRPHGILRAEYVFH
eukprot:489994-Prymnesium_polylepis.1